MAGGKPEVKVYLKSKAGQFLDLFAFWRNDNGMLSGKCDRGVVAIKAVMADGSEVVLKPNEKGYIDGWFVNVRMPDGGAPSPQPSPGARFPGGSGRLGCKVSGLQAVGAGHGLEAAGSLDLQRGQADRLVGPTGLASLGSGVGR
jgi:hypothetical protein